MQQQKSRIAVNFAESLRSARGNRSQAEFARYLGIKHQQTYQAYESGRVPDGETLHQISIKLGVTIDALLSGGRQADLEAAGKKVLLEPGETPWGRELEENTQLTTAVSIICKHLSYKQLLTIVSDILRNDTIRPDAKVFWIKLLLPWADVQVEIENFVKLSPEEQIAQRKKEDDSFRAMMKKNGAEVPPTKS